MNFFNLLRAPESDLEARTAEGSNAPMTLEPCESRVMMSTTSFSSEVTVRATDLPLETVSLNCSKIVWRY